MSNTSVKVALVFLVVLPRLPLHLREAEAGEAEARPQWDVQQESDQTPGLKLARSRC
jgi:hypothetical protein